MLTVSKGAWATCESTCYFRGLRLSIVTLRGAKNYNDGR